MVCPNCKKEIDPNSKFCEHCGAPISAQPIEENTAAETPAPVEQPLEVAQQPTATSIEEKPAYGAENPYFTPIDYIPPQPQEPNEKPKKKKKELAEELGVSRTTLWRMAKRQSELEQKQREQEISKRRSE